MRFQRVVKSGIIMEAEGDSVKNLKKCWFHSMAITYNVLNNHYHLEYTYILLP